MYGMYIDLWSSVLIRTDKFRPIYSSFNKGRPRARSFPFHLPARAWGGLIHPLLILPDLDSLDRFTFPFPDPHYLALSYCRPSKAGPLRPGPPDFIWKAQIEVVRRALPFCFLSMLF